MIAFFVVNVNNENRNYNRNNPISILCLSLFVIKHLLKKEKRPWSNNQGLGARDGT